MKRLRLSDDVHSYGDKNACKDPNLNRSFSFAQRSFYYKPDNASKGALLSSSLRYDRDRSADEDREGSWLVRKRLEHDFDDFDRRKGFDQYRESGYSGGGGDKSLIHRSKSFCRSRREFLKGFRSERDRSRREGSVLSWRRGLKDYDESGRGTKVLVEERVVRSPKGLRDVKSPTLSKDSKSEQSKKRSSSPHALRDAKSKSKSLTRK